MSSVDERLCKLREQRIAREKARIEKLRELNFKKYSKYESQPTLNSFNTTISANKTVSTNAVKTNTTVKNNFPVNVATKRPASAPVNNTRKFVPNKDLPKPKIATNNVKTDLKVVNNVKATRNLDIKPKIADKVVTNTTKVNVNIASTSSNVATNKDMTIGNKNKFVPTKNDPKSFRKSFIPKMEPPKSIPKPKPAENSRKSIVNAKLTESATKPNPNRQSVFERLYQPKIAPKKQIDKVLKLQTDPNYFKKVLKQSALVLNKRHTIFESKKTVDLPVRRSISAVHFKRISKSEMSNCIHKWSSIGEKLDKEHLKINEDHDVKEDKVISAVKSERKKVKFQTPVSFNFNTPKPEELQSRLQNWLKKRGKSLDSYHHLQCFGIHHLPQREINPLNLDRTKFDEFDDEDKENVPLESDSDDDSYTDNMNDRGDVTEQDTCKVKDIPIVVGDEWRRASIVSDSVDLNETQDCTLTPSVPVDDLLVGALNDLTELLREGLEWEQGARWLRAIRERYPRAPDSAPYWECRAALEEGRGNITASVECWEEAIAKGTERSVVEANLDQLLDKFMQLKISPNSGKRKQPDQKMVDIKNVFKSTLIRFAVQQAKLRQSEPAKYTVTPVRRSGRLSAHWSARRTPLRECTSVRQAGLLGHPVVFVPNDKLCGSP